MATQPLPNVEFHWSLIGQRIYVAFRDSVFSSIIAHPSIKKSTYTVAIGKPGFAKPTS